MKTYTLKEDKSTGELHLFESNSCSPKGKCNSEEKSICKKMEDSEHAENLFSCANVKQARKECAEIGERVCAGCIGHLYSTYR